jgi:EpsI family protein
MSDHDQHDIPAGAAPNAVPVSSEPVSSAVSRRHLLMGGAMLAVGGAAYARMPKQRFAEIDVKKFDAMFPKKFGNWNILPSSELIMPPEGDLTAKLYEHILTRTYVNDKGEGMMFLIAYNSEQVNNVQVHRPEICYSASGFKIAHSEPYELKLNDQHEVPTRIVRAERGSRTENIVYWTRIGDEFPQSWLQQRISMTMANLNGFYADGLLVRASVIEEDQTKSVALISDFLRQFAAACPKEARYIAFRT